MRKNLDFLTLELLWVTPPLKDFVLLLKLRLKNVWFTYITPYSHILSLIKTDIWWNVLDNKAAET